MKKWISYGILCILIPVTVIGGSVLFKDKYYAWISLCVVILAFVPIFLRFEKKAAEPKRLILISAMVALSVVGRILFSALPGFKPVTAMVIITAIYFGPEAGFMTGALTALISNFYYGQGPWTPFQMFTWGIIGLIAGIFSEPVKRSKIIMTVFGILSGVIFSMLMDVWSVLWEDGYLNITRYFANVVSSLPYTAVYAVSNVIFLLLFCNPIGKILERIKIKYGL